MAAIFLFLASAAGVSQCQGAPVAPSADYGRTATPRRSPSVPYDMPVPVDLTPSHSGSSGITKSSSTLSREYVEKVLLNASEELEWFGGGSALLTPDVYQGKRMLVYKLAPGSIFGGVRREDEVEEFQSSHENTPLNTGSLRVVTPSHHRGGERKNPLYRHAIKWAIQYLREPPALADMENPYLPSDGSELGSLLKQKLPGRVKTGAKDGSRSLVERLVEKTVRLARSKARGAWISFLLLHYLGFLPSLPGLPRHMDPDQVMASVVNSPSRVMHLLSKG